MIILLYLYMFSSLLFVSSFSLFKAIILGLLVLNAFRLESTLSLQGKDALVLRSLFGFSCTGLFFILYGLVNGHPAENLIYVYFLAPLTMYLLYSCYSSRIKILRVLDIILLSQSLLLIINFGIIIYPTFFSLIANYLYGSSKLGLNLGEYGSVADLELLELSNPSLPSVFYLCIILTTLIIQYSRLPIHHRREVLSFAGNLRFAFVLILCSLGFILILLVNRRALSIVLCTQTVVQLLLPLFIFPFKTLHSRSPKISFKALMVIPLLSLFCFFVFRSSYASNTLINILFALDLSQESSRVFQFHQLTSYWLESPIIGWGLGASVPNYIRSLTHPWSYELANIALLFQIGILGGSLYLLNILTILKFCLSSLKIVPVSQSLLAVALLCGSLSLLLINNTNPYLAKSDFIFLFFLPLLLSNVRLSRS